MALSEWEMSAIVWWFEHSLVLPFLEIRMRIDLFQSCGHCWVFQICWHVECNTFLASFFKVLNSSTGILSHPLALLTAVLPEAHLTSYELQNVWLWVTDHKIIEIWFIKIFFVQFFPVYFPSLFYLFSVYSVSIISVLYCAHLWAKCSLDISNFP